MYLQQISPRRLPTTISANSWHYATVRNSSKGAKSDRTQITGEDQDILYQSFQNSDQVKRYQFSKGSRRIRTNSFFKNKIFSRKNSNFYCSYFQFHSKLLDLSPYIEITGRGGSIIKQEVFERDLPRDMHENSIIKQSILPEK